MGSKLLILVFSLFTRVQDVSVQVEKLSMQASQLITLSHSVEGKDFKALKALIEEIQALSLQISCQVDKVQELIED